MNQWTVRIRHSPLNYISEFSRARKFLRKKHRVRVADAIEHSAVRSSILIFPDKQKRNLRCEKSSIKTEHRLDVPPVGNTASQKNVGWNA